MRRCLTTRIISKAWIIEASNIPLFKGSGGTHGDGPCRWAITYLNPVRPLANRKRWLKPRARSIERLPEKGSGLSRPDTPIDSEVRSQSSCLGINVFSIRLSCPAGASWSRCAMPVSVANLILAWQSIENRTMIVCNEGSLQAHWLDGCRSDPVAGSA
jgi:hypothetical protein